MLGRVAVAAGVVGVTALAAVPALGAGSSAPPAPPACPATPAASSSQIAGYTLSALAAGVRYQLNSPGLLPVGDPQVGNIMETDVPYARTSVSQGPLIDALASPVYPGDTAAHLGTALATFGAPGVPNYPVLADANYPPSPAAGPTAAYNKPASPSAPAVTAQSSADQNGSAASASVASSNVPGASVASSDANAASHVQPACVDTSASAATGTITLAGIIQIGGVTATAAAKSDGTTATPQAALTVGKVTVAGVPASIDRDGVHINGTGLGSGVVQALEGQLQKALASAGMTVKLVDPTTTVNGGTATADSGGIEVTIDQTVPALGQPPLGVPPTPLHIVLEYGAAQATVDATSAPAIPSTSAGGGSSTPPAVPAAGGGGGGAPVVDNGTGAPIDSSGGGAPGAPAPTGAPVVSHGPSGSQTLIANSATRPPLGAPVPIGWLIVGVAVSIMLVGPLLGYARWQLLEGRI